MKTVKAKQTLHGSYGLKTVDSEPFEVTDSVAKDLLERELVDEVGEEKKEKAETKTEAKGEAVTEKAQIKDNTAKGEKKQILKPGK